MNDDMVKYYENEWVAPQDNPTWNKIVVVPPHYRVRSGMTGNVFFLWWTVYMMTKKMLGMK